MFLYSKQQLPAAAPLTAPSRARLQRNLLPLLVLLCATWAALGLHTAWDATRLREAYLPELEAMAGRDPRDGRLQVLLAAREAQATHFKAATQAYEKAVSAGEIEPDVWLGWADAEAAYSDAKRARAVLQVGLRTAPGLQAAASDYYANQVKGATPTILIRLLQSRAAGSFLNPLSEWWGRRHPAQSGFATREAWAAAAPNDAAVQRLWGEALLANRSYADAAKVLAGALALSPGSPEGHLATAHLLEATGETAKARLEYARCLQLRPHWPPALARLSPTGGQARFVDVAQSAGLNYRWAVGGKRPYNILQTVGNGCAFLDYNNDGNLDILLVGARLALYRGDGHGHFADVTHQCGLDRASGHFLGCAVGDYDNDGYDDLYISAHAGGVLLHNDGGRAFRDVTAQSGLASQPWGTSCAFGDADNDGRLDLYVANYVRFGPQTEPQLCHYGGPNNTLSTCGPGSYAAERGVLYHNEGGGRFRDVTQQWSAQQVAGKALAVAFADYSGEGRQSLAIANDLQPGDLLHNLGSSFRNEGLASGTALDGIGETHAGMGVDWGDYDNDGRLDLVVTTFQHQPKCIYHNDGGGSFSERSGHLGFDAIKLYLNFGVKWFDYDNDGWLDLVMANGHVIDKIPEIDKGVTYRQPSQLLHNLGGASFEDLSDRAGEAWQRKIVGRGLAVGDYDNDGRVDVLIVDGEGAPLLLHNECAATGHWLSLRLIGTHSNRDAIGAMVTVEAGGLKQTRRCGTDGSYLSASDRRVHCGLGAAREASVTIRWPDGSTSAYAHVAADRIYTAREGAAALE